MQTSDSPCETPVLTGANAAEEEKQRVRSSHPGVVIRKRTWDSGEVSYFARWQDPDTRRIVDTNLTKLGRRSIASRRKWAIQKSRSLVERRAALASGAPRRTETLLGKAQADYVKACEGRLRESTVRNYRDTTSVFVAWAEKQGVTLVEQVDRALLSRYRDVVVASKKRLPKPTGRRGERAETDRRRSPASINHALRHVKAFVNRMRALGITPLLDRDAISDALTSVPGFRAQPTPLSTTACARVLEAAVRHDLATFKLTRAEHRARPSILALHRTPRYEPISAFVVFVLLTGCRYSEALAVRWDAIDLDAPNDYGKKAGEIRVHATQSKTRTGRRIDLTVSPGLRKLLATMKLRAGDAPYVFGGRTPTLRWRADESRKRLFAKDGFGAPHFTWQQLRQTCASFLTNAPGIFRAASMFRSAEQLGHSPTVAQRFYLDVIRGIPLRAKSLEEAMRITRALDDVIRLACGDEVELAPVAAAN